MVIEGLKELRWLEKTKLNKSNKDKIVKYINKNHLLDERVKKNISQNELRNIVKNVKTELTKDVVVQAIEQGNTTISNVYGKDLSTSKDLPRNYKLLGKNAEKLAKTQKKIKSDYKLSKEEKEVFNKSEQNRITGVGQKTISNLFLQKVHNESNVKTFFDKYSKDDLVKNEIKNLVNQNIETIDTIFKRVGIYREEDINSLKNYLQKVGLKEQVELMDFLMKDVKENPSDAIDVKDSEEDSKLNQRLDKMTKYIKDKNKKSKKKR